MASIAVSYWLPGKMSLMQGEANVFKGLIIMQKTFSGQIFVHNLFFEATAGDGGKTLNSEFGLRTKRNLKSSYV